ncbi:MAG: iron-regulated protein [Myxococcales bacterium]|nr:iron-regulated protein [Myxococcales bacterium]
MTKCLPAFALLVGCGGAFPGNTGDAVATYARIAEASYADSIASAEALNTALTALVSTPSEDTLTAARAAWLDSREPYLQTEVFRFYDGPIDHPTDGPEGLLNAWPLDENYIDYVDGDPDAGYVNGDGTIDGLTLEGRNEVGGEKNIATGYHAIEFLLWGQDTSATGPGNRPFTDYVTDGSGTAANQQRRGTYLTVSGDLVVQHLGQVHDAWAEGADYRTGFEADTEGSFEDILTGMIVLAGFETGGERLQASLDAGDQEEEHSCFSDNTHRDMVQDVQGIDNVWNGTYGPVDGTGIKDVVEKKNADLASEIDAKIQESLDNANALQPPYDQEIAPGSVGNARVQALVTSLRDTEALLSEAFAAFELAPEIPTE